MSGELKQDSDVYCRKSTQIYWHEKVLKVPKVKVLVWQVAHYRIRYTEGEWACLKAHSFFSGIKIWGLLLLFCFCAQNAFVKVSRQYFFSNQLVHIWKHFTGIIKCCAFFNSQKCLKKETKMTWPTVHSVSVETTRWLCGVQFEK